MSSLLNFTSTIATGGDTVQNINGYRIHTFTTVGTSAFKPLSGSLSVEVLVVAGGGSGGVRHAGGGGAGGYIYNSSFLVSGAVAVTVGDGGAARLGSAGAGSGNSGNNSVFSSLTAIGGGYGSQADVSGSGGSSGGVYSNYARGAASQGFQGGTGNAGGEEFQYQGGGGGGAGSVGLTGGGGNNYRAGNGGSGLPFSVSGTSTYYAGGGGGSTVTNMSLALGGVGGIGGGGSGGGYGSPNGTAGTNGTGGGGGAGGFDGGTNYPSGKGGSGIVIVRYPVVNAIKSTMQVTTGGSIQMYSRPILTPVLTNPGDQTLSIGSAVTIFQTALQPASGIVWSFSPNGAGLAVSSSSDYKLTLVASSFVAQQLFTVSATNKNNVTTTTQFTCVTPVFNLLSSAAAASAVGVYSLRSLIYAYAMVAQIRSLTAYPPTMTAPTTSGYTASAASASSTSLSNIPYTGSVGTVTLSAGTYTFTLAGGVGGSRTGQAGGRGMILSAVFTLTSSTSVKYVVGGSGGSFSGGGGGGGASYIYDLTNSRALFVAGGGGGAGVGSVGNNATGSASPGTGEGGAASYASGGGGGGGLFGDGTDAGAGGGKSFLVSVTPFGSGTSAGGTSAFPAANGGFGGGGAGGAGNSGGGGGGYTGGNQLGASIGSNGGTSYVISGSAGLTESATNTSSGYINIAISPDPSGLGALKAFDSNATTFWENFSGTAVSNGYSTSGTYVGTVSSGGAFFTTTGTAGTYDGEWLQIQMPTGMVLQNYSIQGRSGYEATRTPSTFVILGSNDGTTWTLLDTQSGVAASSYASQTVVYFTIASPGATTYTYFRMVVQNVQNTGSIQTVNIAQWSLNYLTSDFYADTLGNLTTATGGSGQTLVNWLGGSKGYVATLYDQSVNGYNLAQPTLNLQPEINLTTTPYSMIFDGSDRWIYSASVAFNMGAGSFTLRYVVSNNTGGCVFFKTNDTTFTWPGFAKKFWLGNGATTESARGNFPAQVGNSENFSVSSTAITATVKNSVVHKANATNSVPIYVNGVQASLSTNNIAMNTDPGNYVIIGRGAQASNYIGNTFEIELFSTRLSDADRLALEN